VAREQVDSRARDTELALSQAQVYRLLVLGMPRDSLSAALAWREQNRGYKPTRRQAAARRAWLEHCEEGKFSPGLNLIVETNSDRFSWGIFR
jgi:hypothetical protein